jgi:hypothetical protein
MTCALEEGLVRLEDDPEDLLCCCEECVILDCALLDLEFLACAKSVEELHDALAYRRSASGSCRRTTRGPS